MERIANEEINRKLLHVVAVALPVFVFYGPKWLELSRLSMSLMVLALLIFSLTIDLLRLRFQRLKNLFRRSFGSMMRKAEDSGLTGATYILGGTLLCSWISLIDDAFAASAFASMTLFVIGDGAAALFGKAFGRFKIGEKTLEGAIGCFLTCLLLTTLVLPNLTYFTNLWKEPFGWLHMLLFPLAISFLELFPVKLRGVTLNDNLYVPILVCLLVLLR